MQRFNRLFLGYENAHGTYDIKSNAIPGSKVNGKALTLPSGAGPQDYQDHLNGVKGLGIVPLRTDNTCYFGAIDIDDYKINHQQLQEKINKFKIPMILFTTKSGGAHLYVFCREAIDAQLLREKMIGWAAKLGHSGAEIFPKQTYRLNTQDIGNWINIPYFKHDATERWAFNEDGQKLTYEEFLDFADAKSIDLLQLKTSSSVSQESSDHAMFIDGPPCLKQLHEDGGFPEGTRNNGMYNVGVFLKKKYPDEWENSMQQYNEAMCVPAMSSNELKMITKSLQKKEYEYSCKQSPICHVCNKGSCLKQKYGIGDQMAARAIEISNITKYDGDPVIWMIEIDGRRVQLRTDELYNQSAFARICMERINRLPSVMIKAKWEKYIDEKLASMSAEDIITVPEDASAEGQFHYLFDMFCNSRVQAKTKEELLSNKPWINEGKIHFTSRSLFEYLDQKRYKYKNEHEVWQMLRKKGAGKGEANIKGRFVNYWVMPVSDQTANDDEKIDFKGEDF